MSVSAQDARAQSWAAHAAQPAERAPIDDSAPSGGPSKKPERVPLYDTVRSITEEPMYKYFDFWLSGPRSGAGMGPWTQGPVTEVSGKMAVVHLHQVPCGEEATAASHYSAVMGVMPTGFRKPVRGSSGPLAHAATAPRPPTLLERSSASLGHFSEPLRVAGAMALDGTTLASAVSVAATPTLLAG